MPVTHALLAQFVALGCSESCVWQSCGMMAARAGAAQERAEASAIDALAAARERYQSDVRLRSRIVPPGRNGSVPGIGRTVRLIFPGGSHRNDFIEENDEAGQGRGPAFGRGRLARAMPAVTYSRHARPRTRDSSLELPRAASRRACQALRAQSALFAARLRAIARHRSRDALAVVARQAADHAHGHFASWKAPRRR